MNPHRRPGQPQIPLDAWTEVLASSIEEGGIQAARDLKPYDTIIDLLPRDQDHPAATSRHQPRTVAQHIPAGTELRVGDDGRVYGVDLDEVDEVTFAGVPVQVDDDIPTGTVQLRNAEGRTLAQLKLSTLAADEIQAEYAESLVLKGGAVPFVHPGDAQPGAPIRYAAEEGILGAEPDLVEVDEAQDLAADQDALVERIFATMGGELALQQASTRIEERIERLEDVADRWGGPTGSRALARRAEDKAEGLRAARRILEGVRGFRISHAGLDADKLAADLDEIPIPLVPVVDAVAAAESSWTSEDALQELLADPSFLPERAWAQPGDPLAELPVAVSALEEVAVAAAVDVDVEVVEQLRDAAGILRAAGDGPEVIRHAIATGLEHAARTLEAGNPVDDLDDVLEIAQSLVDASTAGDEPEHDPAFDNYGRTPQSPRDDWKGGRP